MGFGFSNVFDVGKLILFANSLIALLIATFFIVKSVLISIKILNDVVD
ncbi:hypothetical protein L8U04_06895 [Campylobacter sp. IFREMER_LSEM_CL908]|nr:hypothetical protein [Campylobacter sp. IFREMER_LSEM_CL908]MCV3394266.1 hypothetical protein [Campylobacter sp. IFREMER_LSEM_CL908]